MNGMRTRPPIVLKSRVNNNTYTMYDHQIIVENEAGSRSIQMPLDPALWMICFDDMYYERWDERDRLSVIVATRGDYDQRYELNEDSLELTEAGPAR